MKRDSSLKAARQQYFRAGRGGTLTEAEREGRAAAWLAGEGAELCDQQSRDERRGRCVAARRAEEARARPRGRSDGSVETGSGEGSVERLWPAGRGGGFGSWDRGWGLGLGFWFLVCMCVCVWGSLCRSENSQRRPQGVESRSEAHSRSHSCVLDRGWGWGLGRGSGFGIGVWDRGLGLGRDWW